MQYLTTPIFKWLSGGLAIALLIFIGLWKMEQRRAVGLGHKLDSERALRIADRESYIRAQNEAHRLNQLQVKQIEERQKEITDNVENRYNRDLAELRRLRDQAPGRAPGKPGVSGVPEAPGGAGSADPLRLPPEVLLRAQELELQLKYLIEWVQGQRDARLAPQ